MATDNIIDLSSVRMRARQRGADKRLHPRLECEDRLFTQVVLSAGDPELVGTTLSCTAVNLSIGGVQFRTHTEIPVGCLLDLWVDIGSRPGKFFLAGEVRWTRPATPAPSDGADWFVGVQLKSGAATDILAWRSYHASVNTP